METLYDALLFGDDASTDHLRRRLDENPDLARAWVHWRAVRKRLRRRLDDQLPSRRLLVLYALEEAGHGSLLTDDEKAVLPAARDDIAQAIEAVPALERVVERIQEDQEAFEATWGEHVNGDSLPSERASDAPSASPSHRADRSPRRPSTRRRQWTRRLAVAVLVAGLTALGVLFWPLGPSTTTLDVADANTRVVEFPDGSTVRVVGAATLTHPTSFEDDEARRVTLDRGRAFFDVKRRPDAPRFVVETPSATTTVLGTQFGVDVRRDTTDVVLADGRVQVGSAGTDANAITLEPGQRSRVVEGEPPTRFTTVDLTEALAWTGLFVFRSTPVERIAEQLARHYNAEIEVASALATERVTGTFEREQPVHQIVQALAATLGAEVRRSGEETYRLIPAS